MGLTAVFQIVFAVLIALFVSYFQYFYKLKEAKSRIIFWLSFLRFATVFLLILLFFNPKIESVISEITKPKLLVAVDNSLSIKYLKQDKSVVNSVSLIKNRKLLNAKFDIHYFSFGSEVQKLDSLDFNKSQTNLTAPFTEFQSIFKKGINPVVLISDGNQTTGSSLENVKYSNPVYSLIVGDTTKIEDLLISRINLNKTTYLNNKFPVEIFVNYTGSKSISRSIDIYQNDKKVFTENILFNSVNNSKIISFFLPADVKGNQFYTARLEPLTNEKNSVNNVKNFSIEVVDERTSILLLTAINHPDLGMLKKSIESSKQRTVTISLIQDFKNSLKDHHLVILYQPNSKFKEVFNLINSSKKNYFIVTGLSTDWNFLNTVQSNFSKKASAISVTKFPVFNNAFSPFLIDDLGFDKFPPLEDLGGSVTLNNDTHTLIYQKDNILNRNESLIVTQDNSGQKVGAIFGENSWKWRIESFKKNENFEEFDSFFSNIFQYLSSNSKTDRLQAYTEPFYYKSEPVKISAIYLDNNYKFDSRAKLWLNYKENGSNAIKKIPFTTLESRFDLELSNLQEGVYDYTISVDNEKELLKGTFKIIPFEVEQQFVNANKIELEQLSERTKGISYYSNQMEQLLSNLETDSKFKGLQITKNESTPLIDLKWILGLIIFLLSLEWFTRKYIGKI